MSAESKRARVRRIMASMLDDLGNNVGAWHMDDISEEYGWSVEDFAAAQTELQRRLEAMALRLTPADGYQS